MNLTKIEKDTFLKKDKCLEKNIFDYISENNINTLYLKNNFWFKGKDVLKVLGYSEKMKSILEKMDSSYKTNLKELLDIINKDYTPLVFPSDSETKKIYLNEKGFKYLLIKTKGPLPIKIKPIFSYFNLETKGKHFLKEKKHINSLMEAFSDKIIQTDYLVHKNKTNVYKIDLYFIEYNLAIENDESLDYIDYNLFQESDEKKFIKSKLNCHFITFNSKSEDFNIFKVIKDIRLYMNSQDEKRNTKIF